VTQLVIQEFSGRHKFLSNFEPAAVVLDGERYDTLEAAYQAAKTLNLRQRVPIRLAAGPGLAKKIGNDPTKTTLRGDWDDTAEEVMWDLLNQKFSDPEYRRLLLDTGSATIIEGNYWCDLRWGICLCKKHGYGDNRLGHLLMKLRSTLRLAAT
jgi:ribA/ribD-fused uncharacterized protein